MKACFKVCLNLPENATREDARTYIDDAIRSWKGSLMPPETHLDYPEGDPMFNLDPETVSVDKLVK